MYRGEDEDGLVRRAGERAEREWRVREGMVGVVVNGAVGVGMGEREGEGWWDWVGRARAWTVQGAVDGAVAALVE